MQDSGSCFNVDHAPISTTSRGEEALESDCLDLEASFAQIQAELNYRQARDTLQHLIDSLDLTPIERQGLDPELTGLSTMLDKLNQSVVHIAVFGMVGRGKSSLLNALLGEDVFAVGPTHGITREIGTAQWTVTQSTVGRSQLPLVCASLRSLDQSRIELIDTPGIDEVNGEEREVLAQQVAKQADLILFVVAGDMTRIEYEALSTLRQASKPIVLVFNKADQYPEADRLAIYHKIRDDRVKELLSPDEVVMAAAAPLLARAIRHPNGQISAQVDRGQPQIEALKLKILEILDREGKALIALNTMLYADDVHEQLVERKVAIRDRAAHQAIWNAVITKATVVALNPITIVDMLTGAVIDVAMILTLSRLYGIAMTQASAFNLLQKIAISMSSVSASELLANLGLSSLKGLLGASVPVTGGGTIAPYLSIAITQAGVSGFATYAIGQVAKVYLVSGASWGPEGPKAVVSRILASLDERSILSRIKNELREKLHRNWADS